MSPPDPSQDRTWGRGPLRLPPGLWVAIALLAGAAPWLAAGLLEVALLR